MTQRLHVAMDMRQHGAGIVTDVWYGSILYIFRYSIRQARRAAQYYPVTHGAEISDLLITLNPDADCSSIQAASLVWMDDIPHVFPGSLTAASHRGKTWKGERRKNAAIALYHQRLEAAGFEGLYGRRIGEG